MQAAPARLMFFPAERRVPGGSCFGCRDLVQACHGQQKAEARGRDLSSQMKKNTILCVLLS
jgi:hypothetical protein